MIRKEYLKNIKEKRRPFSMIELDLEKFKKEDDDNYMIENNRPLEDDDIRKLSKPNLDKLVDKLLVNHEIAKFLFCSTANSEIQMFKKSRVVYNKSLPKENKKIVIFGPSDIRRMREKSEVISIVKTEVENNKKRENEENSSKKKKNDEFYNRIKTAPSLCECTTDKEMEKRLKKIFFNLEGKIKKIKLPDVKLDNTNVYSRLYHNSVYIRDKNPSRSTDSEEPNNENTNIVKFNSKKIYKIKNVIENSSGKEFSVGITDDIIANCYSKHSGGPAFKNASLNIKKVSIVLK